MTVTALTKKQKSQMMRNLALKVLIVMMTATAANWIPNQNIDNARNTEGIPVKNQEEENKKGNPNIPNPTQKKVISMTLHHLALLQSN